MVIADGIDDGTVTPYHLLGIAGIIGTCTSVVDNKSIVVKLILHHISSINSSGTSGGTLP